MILMIINNLLIIHGFILIILNIGTAICINLTNNLETPKNSDPLISKDLKQTVLIVKFS